MVSRVRARQTRMLHLHRVGNISPIAVTDFPNAVKRLLKNDILMFRTASSVLHILPIAGLYTFLPKYLESQFRLPAHHANMISGNYRAWTCECVRKRRRRNHQRTHLQLLLMTCAVKEMNRVRNNSDDDDTSRKIEPPGDVAQDFAAGCPSRLRRKVDNLA